VFDRPTVSTRHAQYVWDPSSAEWSLVDLGSTNGTFLRGVRLNPNQKVPIQLGDEVFLGKTFSFVVEESHFKSAHLESEPPKPHHRTTEKLLPNVQRPLAASAEYSAITLDGDEPSEARATSLAAAGIQPTQVIDPNLVPELRSTSTIPSLDPKSSGAEVVAPPSGAISITLGYSADNTVQIKNPIVSGHHARLYQVEGGYIIEDQGSTNGTWVNHRRIQRCLLTEDDQFSMGNHTVSVIDLVQYFAAGTSSASLSKADEALVGRTIRIGRNPECDLQLDAPMVSGFHCQIIALSDGRFELTDLGSTNGTYVNSRENRVSAATLGTDDVVFLGSYRLPLSRLSSLLDRSDGEAGIALPEGKTVMVIGRDEVCDIVLNSPQVSRKHAELIRSTDGTFRLRDLGSINGTYVNGKRIKLVDISPDDLISFANFRVHLDHTSGVVRKDYHGDIMLQAERISVKVRDKSQPDGYKTILDDASFTAYPTEFVGLMGPSGAGKSTLMMALNGYFQPTAGRSLINGYDLYGNYDSYRGNIGYVPQDDIIFPQLTVFESLYYTAKLRLPPDTRDLEIRKKIEDILEKLEIQQTRDIIIGDAVKKGISGGQRKRVNLAMELITEPSLLFLDEPTSGLASEDTINVMNLLRKLSDEGRTIILTIHQPSLEAYRKLDNVIYLFQGRLVYYGPAYPDSITYFHPEVRPGSPEGDLLLSDPGNVLKALADDQRAAMDQPEPWKALEGAVSERRQEFFESQQYKDYVYDRAVAPPDEVHLSQSKQRMGRKRMMRQLIVLIRRYFTIKRKDTVNTVILLLQAPIIAAVLCLVFAGQVSNYFDMVNRGPSALFLLVASAVWFGCSNSAREIVGEQAIYKRERMVNLLIPSYVASKFVVLGLVCAVQCGMLMGIVYPALGFTGPILPLYGLLLLSSLAGVGMGLTLSAIVRSTEAAIALVPLLLIPQIILGGIIMPIYDLTAPMNLMASTMVARWGYEGALHLEFGEDDLEEIRTECGIDVCPDPLAEEWEDSTGHTTVSAFGGIPDQDFFPAGEGASQDICNVLCTNARRGIELTPIERAFGLDFRQPDTLRSRYRDQYQVGSQGTQTSLAATYGVLLLFNLLLFGLVCSILRMKDGDVG